jgi:hypothetical protein
MWLHVQKPRNSESGRFGLLSELRQAASIAMVQCALVWSQLRMQERPTTLPATLSRLWSSITLELALTCISR